MANTDFDTGRPTREGEYSLADETYAKLLRDLAKKGFSGVTPELRANLLSFYRDPKPPVTVAKKAKKADQKGMADTLAALGTVAGAGDSGSERYAGKGEIIKVSQAVLGVARLP
jgi:hypothetical protein